MKKLSIGQKVAHKGTNENAHKVYTGTIVEFDRLAIHFKNDNGADYWLNTWDLCDYPKSK